VNVENLKQLVDPEEHDYHEITFSTDKKTFEISEDRKLPESYESALKRIPLDQDSSFQNSILKNSLSESKLKPTSKGLHFNYLQRRGELTSDASFSELDINKVQF